MNSPFIGDLHMWNLRSTYMTVCPSLISADVERCRTRTWQVFTGHLSKTRILHHSKKTVLTCSSMTRPASSKSIKDDLFSLVPTLIRRPPNFRSRYLVAVCQNTSTWRILCQFVKMDYLSIVCTASGPSSRALAQVFVSADVSSLITWYRDQ